MNKKIKTIIIAIVVLVIILLALIITINIINNSDEDTTLEEASGTIEIQDDGTVEMYEEGDLGIEYEQKHLREPTEFFSVESYIQKVESSFTAEAMDYLSGDNITTYSVYGHIASEETGETTDKYYIVRVDTSNNNIYTYEINDVTSEGYTDLSQIVLETDTTTITYTGNNIFQYTAVTNEEMCEKYLEDIKDKEINSSEELYEMLSDEIKTESFPTLEDFQNYIATNLAAFQNAELASYNVQREVDYTEYTITDNYGNTYTLETEGIWDYTITSMTVN